MSGQNPYTPPSAASSLTAQGEDKARLREIAGAQRQVNLALLAYLCLVPLNIAISIVGKDAVWAGPLIGIAVLCVLVFGAISVFKLAQLFRGSVVAVIYVLGLLVPLLGLILLVTLSQRATTQLKQQGVKVGLLGANPASV